MEASMKALEQKLWGEPPHKREIETVDALIAQLEQYRGKPIMCTWEGTLKGFTIYPSKEGIIMIDSDHEYYREQWQTQGIKRDTRRNQGEEEGTGPTGTGTDKTTENA